MNDNFDGGAPKDSEKKLPEKNQDGVEMILSSGRAKRLVTLRRA